MSDDLVKRLRGWADDLRVGRRCLGADQDVDAAADRIEALERENEKLRGPSTSTAYDPLLKYARREALEEAARLVERNWGTISVSAAGTELPSWPGMTSQLAAAIRALMEKE